MFDNDDDTAWNFPQDDVESEFLIYELIDGAAETIDFHNASAFVKLSWILCVTRFTVVDNSIEEDNDVG